MPKTVIGNARNKDKHLTKNMRSFAQKGKTKQALSPMIADGCEKIWQACLKNCGHRSSVWRALNLQASTIFAKWGRYMAEIGRPVGVDAPATGRGARQPMRCAIALPTARQS